MACHLHAVGKLSQLWSQRFQQFARALIGIFGGIGKHGAAVLINDLDVETLFGFFNHHVFGKLCYFRIVLQGLPQRHSSQCEFSIRKRDFQTVDFVIKLGGSREIRTKFGGQILHILEFGLEGNTVHFDDAIKAVFFLGAESLPHRTRDDLHLFFVL